MVRRSTPSGDKRGSTVPRLAFHATHRLRDIAIDELPPTCASPALGRSPRSTQPIVAGEVNDGRLGNYADPAAARSALPMHASRWATILSANATDTVHTSSFEYRVTLFQRLFASSSDFDLVCREFLADGNQGDL